MDGMRSAATAAVDFNHHHQVYLCRNLRNKYTATKTAVNTKINTKTKNFDGEAAKRPCSHQPEQPPSVRKYFLYFRNLCRIEFERLKLFHFLIARKKVRYSL